MAEATKSLNALLQRTTIDDHEEVLRACNAALKQSKTDINLQHTKLVALLKLDRFDDALRIIEESGDNLKQRTKLERGYALYKVGELEAAKSIAKGLGNDRGARHVEAQASYRSEDFANAALIYKSLAGLEYEESDLRINSGATDAQLEWKRRGDLIGKKKPSREDLEAFETAYNAACGSIARGEFGQGEVLLRRARDLCESLDELSEQEKKAELLPIMVQQLYVFSKLGKTAEAEKLASEIAIEEIPDLSTRQIAQNNRLASKPQSTNPYLDQRILQDTPTLPRTDTLFQFQAERQHENKLTMDLLASKTTGVINSTTTHLPNSIPSTSQYTNTLSVINAAGYAQGQLAKQGLKKMLPVLSKCPKDIGLALTIIQLYIMTNQPGSALTVLQNLLANLTPPDSSPTSSTTNDILSAPGLIALQISLYTLTNQKALIESTFSKAATHWLRQPSPPESLLQAAALTLLTSPNPTHQHLSREIFTHLHSTSPTSTPYSAGYIAAHTLSPTDPPPPTLPTTALPPLPTLLKTLPTPLSTLENAGIPPNPTTTTTATPSTRNKRSLASTATTTTAAAAQQPKKKRRLRKSHLPKDFDEDRVPDPERWLPLRERSSYRPRKRRGKDRGREGERERERVQGAVAGDGKGEGEKKGGEKERERGGVVVGAGGSGGGGGGKGKGKRKGRK